MDFAKVVSEVPQLARGQIRNLGDVRWLATEDGSIGKGTGRHIACFILEPLNTTAETA